MSEICRSQKGSIRIGRSWQFLFLFLATTNGVNSKGGRCLVKKLERMFLLFGETSREVSVIFSNIHLVVWPQNFFRSLHCFELSWPWRTSSSFFQKPPLRSKVCLFFNYVRYVSYYTTQFVLLHFCVGYC